MLTSLSSWLPAHSAKVGTGGRAGGKEASSPALFTLVASMAWDQFSPPKCSWSCSPAQNQLHQPHLPEAPSGQHPLLWGLSSSSVGPSSESLGIFQDFISLTASTHLMRLPDLYFLPISLPDIVMHLMEILWSSYTVMPKYEVDRGTFLFSW